VNQQEHEEIAELLLEVYANREPVEPLAAKFAGLTVDDAYEIQLLQVRRWLAGGAQVKGHKVGLTSGAMQRQLAWTSLATVICWTACSGWSTRSASQSALAGRDG
jgi:2-keto-4-pentenoate hydratase